MVILLAFLMYHATLCGPSPPRGVSSHRHSLNQFGSASTVSMQCNFSANLIDHAYPATSGPPWILVCLFWYAFSIRDVDTSGCTVIRACLYHHSCEITNLTFIRASGLSAHPLCYFLIRTASGTFLTSLRANPCCICRMTGGRCLRPSAVCATQVPS